MAQRMSLIAVVRRDFVVLIVILGLLVSAVAYYFVRRILQERFEQQASFLATNLGDAAAGHIASKNILQLHTLLTKYGRLDGVAYALVQDRDRKILATSLQTAPSGLQEDFEHREGRELGRRSVTFHGKPIYESRAPILEGRLGTARVGIWVARIDQEVYRGFLVFIGPIALVFVAAVTIAVLLTGRLARPLRRLMDIAGRMSTGDLDTPVRAESHDEFGELTNSLERMRASLKAAMMRLGHN
jgi:HAMP domain-containing protein